MTSSRFLRPVEVGERFTAGWSMKFTCYTEAQAPRSPWHHLPLIHDRRIRRPLFNFLNEIPKGQREKLEVSTKVAFNPIVQDKNKKNGSLRSFTYGDIPFNYGCLPQTWEDPSVLASETGCKGDGDPVDVVELSGESLPVGSVTPVRTLGVLALIDEGETDWKVIAVSETAALKHGWKSISDVPTTVLDGVVHWFRFYKTTDGKPENQFAFDGKILGEEPALDVIEDCYQQYRNLLDGATPNPGLWVPEK